MHIVYLENLKQIPFCIHTHIHSLRIYNDRSRRCILMHSQQQSKEARLRFWSFFQRKRKSEDLEKFVLLSWKRSGSNLLSRILHLHPEIIMHNELFNPIDIFTNHPRGLLLGDSHADKWSDLARDLHPKPFLEHIWSGCFANGTKIKS